MLMYRAIRALHPPQSFRRVFQSVTPSAFPYAMPSSSWAQNPYPPAFRSDHVDIYKSASKGEIRVADPYQWLEEDSEETNKWTSAQEAFTRTYLDKNPDRKKLEDVFRASMDYARFSAPILFDDQRWYWFHNSGLQAQSVLFRSKDATLPNFSATENGGGEIFFDSNLLSSDGTAALADYDFSTCGKYFSYGISYSGSDFTTLYVRSTDSPLSPNSCTTHSESGRLPEEIRFVKFSTTTWTHDSKGFFYQRYPDRAGLIKDEAGIETQGDRDAMIYYHQIGTPQSDDILVHKDEINPEWMFSMQITEDGKYLCMYTMKDSSRKNKLWIADLEANEIGQNIKWIKVVDAFEAEFGVVTNDGSLFYLKTNQEAPQYKVVVLDIAKDNRMQDFIPEDKDAFLTHISCVNKDKFAVIYKRSVKDEIYIYSKTGERQTRLAPDFVGAASVSSRKKQPWFLVTMTGFSTPGTVSRYNFENPEGQRWNVIRSVYVKGLDPMDFEARQVWYESKDGTKVPMFIVRHKSTPYDGTASAIQYGYGGFSISVDPFFSPTILAFLQTYGAILAVPNIRGGSEFGEDWHKGGSREKKVNCFDDFIAATEYLVKNKFAAAGKIAINGGSNGGLLVGACVNRAPEGTFGAAVAEVGVMDLLKFSKFTIGKAWTSDYGDPSDPNDFDFIYPISPLHNIPTDKVLPPVLLTTADHDDRVVPMHSFKHAAALQHALPRNPHPLLLRVDKKAGHGAGKSTEKRIQGAADKWGFVAQSLGLVWKETSLQANF